MKNSQTFAPIVDWLIYRSYEHSRVSFPHIPYYKWRKIYRDALQFEEIFEENLKIINEKGAWGHEPSN